jgi:hypothetical protein
MSKLNIKLIKGSIKKWENIRDNGVADKGPHDCPLCKKYIDRDCSNCPINLYTGNAYCHNSPYHDWGKHHDDYFLRSDHSISNRIVRCKECIELCNKEIEFLYKILKIEEDK